MKNKVLLFGGNGWIGTQVCGILKSNIDTEVVISKVRLDDYNEVMLELCKQNPTHVISTIGRTHGIYQNQVYGTIDYLELPGKLVDNIRDNLYGIALLARATEKLGIHMTYLGTGCIFNDDHQHPKGFYEYNRPNFFGSSYSIVKGFTDNLVKMYDHILNVRIRMPITAEPNDRDFITKLTKYSKICSIENSMTVLDELLPIMVDMTLKNEVGTINLTNPGVITHNEILQMYKEIVDPTFEWETFSYSEQMLVLKSHRSNNKLNTDKLESKYKVKHIRDSVKEILLKRKELLQNK